MNHWVHCFVFAPFYKTKPNQTKPEELKGFVLKGAENGLPCQGQCYNLYATMFLQLASVFICEGFRITKWLK